MSLLVVLLPASARRHPQLPPPRPEPAAEGASAPTAGAEGPWTYVLSPDGARVESEGQCAAALLPRATSTVAVVHDVDLGWHALPLPKAPASRLQAALVGALEDELAEDTENLHLAVAPGTSAGQTAWVAACDRRWLSRQIQALEQALGRTVDRVVPLTAPGREPSQVPSAAAATASAEGESVLPSTFGAPVQIHFQADPRVRVDGTSPLLITSRDRNGVSTWPTGGSYARFWQDQWRRGTHDAVQFSAAPAVASAAEHWLGLPVQVVTDSQRLLRAAESPWQLRQFDLAPRHRGLAVLRGAWQRFLTPEWRPVRWGLLGLAAVHLLGLNLWAWHEGHELQARKNAMTQLLRQAHPQVRAILDAPVQMQRENDTLRAQAGRAGDGDLETLMAAAASAWPEHTPIQKLNFKPGTLTLAAPTLNETQMRTLKDTLGPAGWRVEGSATEFTLQRSPPNADGRPGDRRAGPRGPGPGSSGERPPQPGPNGDRRPGGPQ